jgi:hypothetical protein
MRFKAFSTRFFQIYQSSHTLCCHPLTPSQECGFHSFQCAATKISSIIINPRVWRVQWVIVASIQEYLHLRIARTTSVLHAPGLCYKELREEFESQGADNSRTNALNDALPSLLSCRSSRLVRVLSRLPFPFEHLSPLRHHMSVQYIASRHVNEQDSLE